MKPNKLQIALLILIAVITVPFIRATGSCCGDSKCPMMSSRSPVEPEFDIQPLVDVADDPALMEPVKSVYARYLKIQEALAKDSMGGISENAAAMAKAVKGDKMKMLSTDIANQSDDLSRATDLKAARKAFKPLSESLIKYLADHKVKSGNYTEAYCPMADASWLQTGKNVSNPYYGKSMSSCGEIKRKF